VEQARQAGEERSSERCWGAVLLTEVLNAITFLGLTQRRSQPLRSIDRIYFSDTHQFRI